MALTVGAYLWPERERPVAIAAVVAAGGLVGCVVLVVALPPAAVLGGTITLAIGVVVRRVTSTGRR